MWRIALGRLAPAADVGAFLARRATVGPVTVADLADDEAQRALVITAEGRYFTAGKDIGQLSKGFKTRRKHKPSENFIVERRTKKKKN